MTATQDLIAAALTAADLMDETIPYFHVTEELRELCARSMCEPDMEKMERLVSALIEAAHDSITLGDYADEDTVRAALLDYVRGAMAERDALIHDNKRLMQIAAQEVSAAPQPVGAADVPMPEPVGWANWYPKGAHVIFGLSIHEPREVLDREQVAKMSDVLTYGNAREAAGYARGLAEADKLTHTLAMPEPIGRLYFGGVTCGERDEWEFDADQVVCDGINESATEESRQRVYLHRDVRTYGVQCRAAGYAAGVAAAQTLQSLRELAAEADAALRGEVKP